MTDSIFSVADNTRYFQAETRVMLSSQFVDDDDEVFDQTVPDAVTRRVLPPTSFSYRYSHRVSFSDANTSVYVVNN